MMRDMKKYLKEEETNGEGFLFSLGCAQLK